ncbi:hypothetical protein J5N97_025546 [Dioscorea zingiberensis]|uniref:Secreted protein n=1 Tax=Dioscorea zingiberensis TaxID=325984 RepID=A0A9D5H9R4_9LILI|nr:hypothetical protein J5N97_025546 [Dioscorea zingiberensis]
MDVLLLMSILSASPAEISGGRWQSLMTNGGRKDVKEPKTEVGEGRRDANTSPSKRQQQQERPRFAPEFDGLNCFETLVFH